MKRPLASAFFTRYATWRIGRDLDGVHVHGLERLVQAAAEGPVLVASNHHAWWDGMLLMALDRLLDVNFWALMDARSIERLPFLGWIGGVPLDLSTPESSSADLARAAALLDRPNELLWVFPQGRQRPQGVRPLQFQPGVCRIAQLSGAPVVPVSLCYSFREAPQPAAFIHVGEPQRSPEPDALEAAVVDGLDAIDAGIEAGQGYAPLFDGRGRRPDAGLGARLLGAEVNRG